MRMSRRAAGLLLAAGIAQQRYFIPVCYLLIIPVSSRDPDIVGTRSSAGLGVELSRQRSQQDPGQAWTRQASCLAQAIRAVLLLGAVGVEDGGFLRPA
jgi:hypothetical protein